MFELLQVTPRSVGCRVCLTFVPLLLGCEFWAVLVLCLLKALTLSDYLDSVVEMHGTGNTSHSLGGRGLKYALYPLKREHNGERQIFKRLVPPRKMLSVHINNFSGKGNT